MDRQGLLREACLCVSPDLDPDRDPGPDPDPDPDPETPILDTIPAMTLTPEPDPNSDRDRKSNPFLNPGLGTTLCTQDAAPSAAKSAPRAEGIDAELDAAHVSWLPGGVALLLLRSGQMLLVSLEADGGVTRRIQARRHHTS